MNIESVVGVGGLSVTNLPEQNPSSLVSGVNDFTDKLNRIDEGISAVARGENVEMHELMVDLETAKLQLEMSIAVRDKLIEAYKEITRMQV